MTVPNGYDDASDEMKIEYLANAKQSSELVAAIIDELGLTQRRDRDSLKRHEKAALCVRLGVEFDDTDE